MNKLLLIFLLSILILYAQCDPDCIDFDISGTSGNEAKINACKEKTTTINTKECVPNSAGDKCEEKVKSCPSGFPGDVSTDPAKKTFCEALSTAANKKCQLKSDKSACELVDKPASSTNSGSILNALKITFTLIIIFAIL